MNPPVNPSELAQMLSPTQFELLVRSYIQGQFAKLRSSPGLLMLVADTDYNKTSLRDCHWQLGTGSETTKGEILAEVVQEHDRRRGFTEACKLALIEAALAETEPPEPAPTAPLDDKSPF
jgi:hypothetical protein